MNTNVLRAAFTALFLSTGAAAQQPTLSAKVTEDLNVVAQGTCLFCVDWAFQPVGPLPAGGVEAASLAAALENGAAAVGYRRLPRTPSGPDHVLAHVLTADGTLTRVDLGPAAELEDLAGDWRAALGAPLVSRGKSVRPQGR